MIKLLDKSHHSILNEFLIKDRSYNAFILGDIYNFGYESDFQSIWGEFDNSSLKLKSVLLKYFKSFIFYGSNDSDYEAFYNIIQTHVYDAISGSKESLSGFEKYFQLNKKLEMNFSELVAKNFGDTNEIVYEATLNDAKEIYDLRTSIIEFKDVPLNIEMIKNSIKGKGNKIYFLRKNSKIVSTVETTAECPNSVVIVGACTHKDYRKQGLLTNCLKEISNRMFKLKKNLILFYDNPEAAKIYINLGFKPSGKWIIFLKPELYN